MWYPHHCVDFFCSSERCNPVGIWLFIIYIPRDGNFPGRAGTKDTRDGPGQGTPGNPGNGTLILDSFIDKKLKSKLSHQSHPTVYQNCMVVLRLHFCSIDRWHKYENPLAFYTFAKQEVKIKAQFYCPVSRPVPGQRISVPFPGKFYSGKFGMYTKIQE